MPKRWNPTHILRRLSAAGAAENARAVLEDRAATADRLAALEARFVPVAAPVAPVADAA
jgi:hypothetical protein